MGRHKEILTEIFYFTKHPDVPLDSDSILEQAVTESIDLKEFLNLNDLERLILCIFKYDLMSISGHVFEESTLPKLQTVPVNATVEGPTVNGTTTKVPPPTPVTPPNPNTSTLPPQPPSSGSGRMMTRVSSGAIRQKSIGEILGEKEVQLPSFCGSNAAVYS